MEGLTLGTLSPAFWFVALILVTNYRKTCVRPEQGTLQFLVLSGLSKYAAGS